MLFERIESEGLAHYSYLIGEKDQAIVIDPRRDADIYFQIASRNGYRITDILETHRNEDYVVGSVELAARTGAQVWHADDQFGYQYGFAVQDRQQWELGSYVLEAIHTPGHTPGHMSYLLRTENNTPWILFCGDTLFAGDIGRVDLLGEAKLAENAGILFDTLYQKILPMGDQVILCPAHGAGSVCGSIISDRTLTTIGLERKLNGMLQMKSREEFVKRAAVMHERPPYFSHMEKLNTQGPSLLDEQSEIMPLAWDQFEQLSDGAFVLDTRNPHSFATSHIPHSISIWRDGLSSFAGWFVPFHLPILLVGDSNDCSLEVNQLRRMGYDNIAGFLAGGIASWESAGQKTESIKTTTVHHFSHIVDKQLPVWTLDVRGSGELVSEGKIAGAHHLHITQINRYMETIPRDQPVYIFCGSGKRSMIAASILKAQRWVDLTVVLGGTSGWQSIDRPIDEKQPEEEIVSALLS
ncbi:MAG: MBL fold metallo-hydrolase [Chitinivibrionales bacterium]